MSKDNKEIIEVENFEETNKPTLEVGNYVIEISDINGLIKKIAVANSAINVTKLKDGGFTVDL